MFYVSGNRYATNRQSRHQQMVQNTYNSLKSNYYKVNDAIKAWIETVMNVFR